MALFRDLGHEAKAATEQNSNPAAAVETGQRDRFLTGTAITFANNSGAGTGTDLNASANNAIAAATALNGGTNTVASQFTFGGRTYLAINLANAGFLDADDLLLDITGATGTIRASNFI
jgi:hypothetical protein